MCPPVHSISATDLKKCPAVGSRRGIVAKVSDGFDDARAYTRSLTGALRGWKKCWTDATPDAASPRRCRHRRWSRPPAPSIFLLEVLLHVPAHLDQTAPNLLEERDHLVDLGIARQLELSLAGLCA